MRIVFIIAASTAVVTVASLALPSHHVGAKVSASVEPAASLIVSAAPPVAVRGAQPPSAPKRADVSRSAPPEAAAAPVNPSARPETHAADGREQIEAAFFAEPADPAWARTAETQLRTQMPPGTLRNVECHSSICRVETEHESRDAFGTFYQRAIMMPETRVWKGSSFSTLLDETAASRGGPLVVVTYLAREGRELPRPE
jgi:hypothetical protein